MTQEPTLSLSELADQFQEFREQCIWISVCYRNYEVLFETDEKTLKLLGETAAIFFHDLNKIIIEYVMIISARIMDPPETMRRENLTILYLNRALAAHDLLTEEITRASAATLTYKDVLKDARNRLLAHLDLETVMKGKTLGVQKEDAFPNFMKSLQVYLDLVGEAVGVGPLSISPGGGVGDAIDLVRALRKLSRKMQ